MPSLREAARRTGIALLGPPLDDPVQPPEYRRVFAAIVEQRAEALIVSDFAGNFTYRQLIVELAEASRLPAIYPYRDHAALGGLMAYAADFHDLMRHAANQVHRVLRGEKPGEIPYYQARIFALIINMRTAKALGITSPHRSSPAPTR
jgi:putative tryptophan/tyrosine transport system substrate-binding protein